MKVLLVGLTIVAGAVGAGVGYAGLKTSSLPGDFSGDISRGANSGISVERTQADNGGQFPDGFVSGNATYEDGRSADISTNTPAGQASPDTSSDANSRNSNNRGSLSVSSAELNAMVTEAIASQPYTAPILDAAQDITTAIKNNRIESGARINLSDLPLDALPTEGQQAVEQLTQTFPFLANRDVYIGVEGTPSVVDGELSLEDTYIRFGQLRLPVGRVANQLGLSQSEIEQQISALLDQQGMNLSDVRIEDGQLVISGQ